MENIPEREEKSLDRENHFDQKIEKQTYNRLIVDLSDRPNKRRRKGRDF